MLFKLNEKNEPCNHPQHNMPEITLPDGIYRHICPFCGFKKEIEINTVTFNYEDVLTTEIAKI